MREAETRRHVAWQHRGARSGFRTCRPVVAWDPGASRPDHGRDALVAAGRRVLVPDLLGFGHSDRPAQAASLWLDGQAAALGEVLVERDVGRVVIVGHDYGVPLAVTLVDAGLARPKGMVLTAGNVFTDTPVPTPLRALSLPVVGRAVARLALSGPSLRVMLRAGMGRPRIDLDPAIHVGDRAQQHAIRTIFGTALRELPERYEAVESALPRLDVPVQVLWGDRDPFFPISEGRRVAAAIPGAQLRVLAGAGHFLPAERPSAVVAAVEELATQ
ncbi:MAG: alpha/beta hydrolase [Xanthomonadales bacterium]|nr:alpha/beta hydrolase [Xanthomonadales bacterium]